MTTDPQPDWNERIDAIYRRDGRKAFATLVRLLGDFDRAEDALQEALRCALLSWPRQGEPANPSAWLVATGRHRALDARRRDARFQPIDVAAAGLAAAEPAGILQPDEVADDRLRLVFTCCHPSLDEQAQVALTLREVCGLDTEEIARAFLVRAPTLAQRIVRAKTKIRTAGIPFEVPRPEQLPERLPSVLRVVYLVFNEGYSASRGDRLLRVDLGEEAIRLARLLHTLLPEPEVAGLLALCLLQQSRVAARTDAHGDLVPLDEQDRRRWDRGRIDEGIRLVEAALRSRRFGAYCLQAAIAAVHAEAERPEQTDWVQIEALYGVLLGLEPQPVVALNRAVATAMRGDLDAGLREIDQLLAGPLVDYHLAHAARADLCRRAGRFDAARAAYEQALRRVSQEAERRFLQRRILALPHPGEGPP